MTDGKEMAIEIVGVFFGTVLLAGIGNTVFGEDAGIVIVMLCGVLWIASILWRAP